ncbi:hypothetical protein AMTRI_Chr06g172960 [Amborella trichopoda]
MGILNLSFLLCVNLALLSPLSLLSLLSQCPKTKPYFSQGTICGFVISLCSRPSLSARKPSPISLKVQSASSSQGTICGSFLLWVPLKGLP